MHAPLYIYVKIYTFRAFQILKYPVALIFIRVHSPLFFCHFSTVAFSHGMSRSWSLCHFSTATFSRWVSRSWSWHQKFMWGIGDRMHQLIIYCFWHIVDLVVLLVYYSNHVDKSGSLSGGAFNQLRLVTLNIVLTILYWLKTVLQWSLLQCLNSLYKSDEVF